MTAIVQPVIDRLTSGAGLAPLGLVSVEEAGALAAALERTVASRQAFVLWTGETAQSVACASEIVEESVAVRFAVVVGYTDAGPKASNWSAAWDATSAALKQRLRGWQHPAGSPVTFVAGTLLPFREGERRLFHQHVYSFTTLERSV